MVLFVPVRESLLAFHGFKVMSFKRGPGKCSRVLRSPATGRLLVQWLQLAEDEVPAQSQERQKKKKKKEEECNIGNAVAEENTRDTGVFWCCCCFLRAKGTRKKRGWEHGYRIEGLWGSWGGWGSQLVVRTAQGGAEPMRRADRVGNGLTLASTGLIMMEALVILSKHAAPRANAITLDLVLGYPSCCKIAHLINYRL